MDDLVEAVLRSAQQHRRVSQLTHEQAIELDRRVERYRHNPDDVVPWDSIKKDIEAKWLKIRSQGE